MKIGEKTLPMLNSAESVEQRVLAKRKAEQAPVTATQGAGQVECGLLRLHAAAKREPDLQFNNLLHHTQTFIRCLSFFEPQSGERHR